MSYSVRILIAAGAMAAGAVTSANDTAHAKMFDFDHVSCNGKDQEIRLVIKGVDKAIGRITADLYRNDQEGFLKRAGRVSQVKFAAKSPKTSFCIKAPQEGAYAIAIYHDENANNTFDKGAFGLPAEPWGISNNPKVRFKAPTVDEALFDVTAEGAEVFIKLN